MSKPLVSYQPSGKPKQYDANDPKNAGSNLKKTNGKFRQSNP
jgi:hypothetical protein